VLCHDGSGCGRDDGSNGRLQPDGRHSGYLVVVVGEPGKNSESALCGHADREYVRCDSHDEWDAYRDHNSDNDVDPP
jgi:hypothetical protein